MLQFMRHLMFFVRGVVLTYLTMSMWKNRSLFESAEIIVYSESLAAIQPKLCRFKVYLPHPQTKGTADLRDGWGTPDVFGMDVLT